ncbi:MAG: hypothetical protein QG641_928 [Candidatus Poribacteria bacterium]|nr:hypothetical protein [Candidatus Poribacteria bacterium]
MKKVLILSFIFCMVITSVAFGASARWQALGNEQRFIIDTSNYTPYPARIYQFSNAVWLIPKSAFGDNDINAGWLTKLNPNMMAAFHFNLPSAGTTKLSSALASYTGKNDRLAGLTPRTFPDVFWAMKSGTTTVAARVALAMDKSDVTTPDSITTNAMATDVSVGATMAMPFGDVDLGIGAGIQNFKDDAGGKITESTGGYAITIDARINAPMDKDKKCNLVPILNVKLGADPTQKDVTETTYMGGDIGIGIRTMYEKKMVVGGLVMAYNSVTDKPVGKAEVKTTTFAPKFIAGCEIPLTKWIVVRGGANAELSSKSNGSSSMDVKYYYNSGIRMMYGGFIVDLILSRDIFHRGPYLLSGSGKDGSNLATNICITYAY